ncbi:MULTISPECIES: phage tail protein [Idiomarina]|uniref:phage tail protein n=1 Tax=Idiomarina TaxID=135575 RepID=UPI00129C47A2|nr:MULTISPECIES: tail fiber protein [Idiomarina]MRJ42973.1 phage tail protein [Idiomarina sp. FeN1]NCU58525.1 phage tail protein [Idiomarina sp. FenA--70]NCU61222.1 phage tail protein [Idiomarina sp. FenBw--71]UUN12722.1 phage tail protein [Idiomarina loihiensis]
MSDFYLGEIRIFAGDYAPQGWYICAGQSLQIVENEALFSLLGTTYGGDGQTHFKLPDMRSRIPIGIGTNPATGSNVTRGQTLGTETETLTAAEMPSHQHSVMVSIATGDTNIPANNALNLGDNKSYSTSTNPADINVLNAECIKPEGHAMAHENRMPMMALNYIIAHTGIYPSQY